MHSTDDSLDMRTFGLFYWQAESWRKRSCTTVKISHSNQLTGIKTVPVGLSTTLNITTLHRGLFEYFQSFDLTLENCFWACPRWESIYRIQRSTHQKYAREQICMQTKMGLILHTFKSRGKNLKGGVSRCCCGILEQLQTNNFMLFLKFRLFLILLNLPKISATHSAKLHAPAWKLTL